MTVTTRSPGTAGIGDKASSTTYRLSYWRVMRSEWIRFWTLRTNLITLASMCAAIVLFGVLSAASATGAVAAAHGSPMETGTDPVSIVLSGGRLFGVLVMGVLGVLIGAREYNSGLIRVMIAAVPNRIHVLTAKIAVFAAITAPSSLLATLVAFVTGTAILEAAGHASSQITDPGVASAVIGTACYLVGIGIAGIAIGVLLRSIGGGIATIIGGVLILPQLATSLLPDSWDSVLKFLPSNAGASFTSVTPPTDYLSNTTGALVFTLWIILVVIGAAVAIRVRDV